MGGEFSSCGATAAVLEDTLEEEEVQRVVHHIIEDIRNKGVGAAVQDNAPEVAMLAGVAVTELTSEVLGELAKEIEANVFSGHHRVCLSGGLILCGEGLPCTVEEFAEAVGKTVAAVRQQAANHIMEDIKDKEVAMSPFLSEEHTTDTAADLATVAQHTPDTAADAQPTTEVPQHTLDECVHTVTLVMLDKKGAVRQADFTTRKLGLELALGGGRFCGAKGQAGVVVKTLEKGGQAEVLGVQRSWKVTCINGTEVTGLQQARCILADSVAKLPEA